MHNVITLWLYRNRPIPGNQHCQSLRYQAKMSLLTTWYFAHKPSNTVATCLLLQPSKGPAEEWSSESRLTLSTLTACSRTIILSVISMNIYYEIVFLHNGWTFGFISTKEKNLFHHLQAEKPKKPSTILLWSKMYVPGSHFKRCQKGQKVYRLN